MPVLNIGDFEVPPEVRPETLRLYSRMYQLENWMREMVYLELKAHHGPDWWTKAEAALARRKGRTGIPPKKSLARDQAHPHMSTPENDPVWFLTFDDLLKLILDVKLWPLFYPYLTTKTLLRAKFDEIKPVRNRVAHFRRFHPDDLNRLERVMKDLDQGFWKFCTSYNDQKPFIAHFRSDPVYRQFASREHVGFTKVGDKEWALVGVRAGVSMDLSLRFSVRPSCRRKRIRSVPRNGALYDFTFTVAHTDSYLAYDAVLAQTRHWHDRIVHIMLDVYQKTLRVTMPRRNGVQDVTAVMEDFYNACMRSRSRVPSLPVPPIELSDASGENYDKRHAPLDRLAFGWPHYVVPPRHPFTFLGPDMPCNFFGVEARGG